MKQDWLLENNTRIYDDRGNQRGYMKRDSLSEDRTNIYLDR